MIADPSTFVGFQAVSVSVQLSNGRWIHGSTTYVRDLTDYLRQMGDAGIIKSIASTPVLMHSYN